MAKFINLGLVRTKLEAWRSSAAVRGGVQSSLGMFVALAIMSPPTVWNALSEEQVGISPVYALVSYNVVLQATVGAAIFFMLQRVGFGAVGSVLGLALMYITYGSNSDSYASTVTKGAVMCTFFTLFTGVIVYYQQVMSKFVFGFVVTQVVMSVVALTGYHDPFRPLASPYMLLQLVLGVVFAFLASLLFFPTLAGRSIEEKTQEAILNLGQGTEYLVKEILLQKKGTKLDDSDKEKEPIAKFYDLHALKVSQSLVAAKTLVNDVVATEINVYSKPHIFPRKDYGTLLSLLRHCLSILMTTLYFYEDTGSVLGDEILEELLLPFAREFSECAVCLAEVLTMKMTYTLSLESLRKLESSLIAIEKSLLSKVKYTEMKKEGQTPSILLNVFALGVTFRRCFLVVPGILQSHQTKERNTWTVCKNHFEARRFNLRDVFSESDADSMIGFSLSSLSSISLENQEPAIESGISSDFASIGRFPVRKESFKHPNSPNWIKKGRDLSERLHVKPTFLKIALQQMVAILIGTVIHVTDASYNALKGHTVWIIFTIVVLGAQGSYGSMMLKLLNRLFGTAVGGAAGLVVIYLVYLINGLSYANNPLKFIIMILLTCPFNGYFTAKGIASSAQFFYAWVVVKITFPIIVFVGYSDDAPNPETAGYRLLCILIGSAIEVFASSVVFARNTSVDTRHKIQDILQKMAILSQETASLMLDQTFSSSRPHDMPSFVAKSLEDPKKLRQVSKAVKEAALGELVIKIRPLGIEIGHSIESLKKLEAILRFEESFGSFFGRYLRFPFRNRLSTLRVDDVEKLRRKLRRLLNELLTLAYLKDSMEVEEMITLNRYRKEVDSILCLRIPESLSHISLSLGHNKGEDSSESITSLNTLKVQFDTLLQHIMADFDSEISKPPLEDQIITCASLKVISATISCLQRICDIVLDL
jgi:hypothetical protein